MASPFPYAWLPRWTRAEASQATVIARAVQPVRSLVSSRTVLAPRWEALLGGRVEAWPGVPSVLGRDAVHERFGGVSVAAVMRHGLFGTMAMMIDAPFALTLAARALGADEPGARRAGATRAFGPAQEGALAMLCAQAATLVCAPSAPPAVRGVTDRVTDATAAIGADTLLVWSWRVSAGIEAGEASLVMDARALASHGAALVPAWNQLAEVEVPVALRIARASLPLYEIAALGVGDVVLTDLAAEALDRELDAGACMLSLGPTDVPVSLRGDEVTFADCARPTRRLEMAGNDGAGDNPESVMRTDVLASVPVDVDVVIARVAIPLADIAAWRVGEVMAFPSRVGELVEVRAGGKPVARGELCDVDGMLGVRVTELL